MNRKALILVAAILAAIMAFPMISAVQAVPDKKEDFALRFTGASVSVVNYRRLSPASKTSEFPALPPDGPAVSHVDDVPWIQRSFDILYLEIGGLTIPKEYLEYSALVSYEYNRITREYDRITAEETVKIFTSTVHTTPWGMINMQTIASVRRDPDGNVIELGKEGSFQGHGAGALEGVNVHGASINTVSPIPERSTMRNRVGTIIGWPLSVTVWPPP